MGIKTEAGIEIEKIRIGWFGVGNMGYPMARRMLGRVGKFTVLGRPSTKTQKIIAEGAFSVDKSSEMRGYTDYVFSMVQNADVLSSILFGADGLLSGAIPNEKPLAVIDMSTIDPVASERIAENLLSLSVGYLRAPVTGSTEYAAKGTLGVMASGPKELFEEVLPLLRLLSDRQTWLGEREQARCAKIALNILLAHEMQALAEALVLAQKATIPWETMIDLIADSAGAAPIIRYKTEALKKRDFTAMSAAETMAKDLDIALDIAKQKGLSLPGTALTRQFYAAMTALGLGQADMSGLVLVQEKLNGL
jgi:3-hydroxyisobutyrate dehydrogenase-like beta-hydroxyacid dehydrogenase